MLMTTLDARSSAIEADPRWKAVLARDATHDGRFVYAVTSTGIYCRPSCPARRPALGNVAFYASAPQAQAAGFRACMRCRPDATGPAHAETIAAACRRIREAEEPLTLADLATGSGLSPHHFHRIFKAATGLTPHAYAAADRARRMRESLKPDTEVTAAVYDSGFASLGRFYAQAGESLGMAPSRYRRGGEGEAIRFAIADSSLGAILVAATERGVCAILIGDDPEALARDLQDRFPNAMLIPGDGDFETLVARVVAFAQEPRGNLDLPLDLRGTAFQLRVWQALREIPPGTTLSYGELARRLGLPAASRAVAGACAANHVAIAVPCHRIVRNGGSISGYRWGVARKRLLLDREREA